MKLGITGHRPQKLYGFNENHPGNLYVIHAIKDSFEKLKPVQVITGMALGADQWAAQWCIAMGIPFVAVIPNKEQYKVWPEKAQQKYLKIMEKAQSVVITAQTEEELKQDYSSILQKRNEMIVDMADHMLGIYGGGMGGTRNCLEYAKEQNKSISLINPGGLYSTD